MASFSKILIANRGEIAVRVIRACQEMGIATVAVSSEADADSLHVRLADETVFIGPPPAAESYLVAERILQAAHETGAQAIHPGYGFLSENPEFAQGVIDSGLTFIGPDPKAIQAMGDKAKARASMDAAGVPIIPGYQGSDDDQALARAADEIGYPVLVKAAAGGGGKGMRIAKTQADFPEAIAAARREASHAFGDPRLILERYISRARHIEFQILADQHANTFHLNERDCSVQRRHQKIIEETPSPLLDNELRAEMGAAAIAAAKAVGYTNAGTVEFIFEPDTGTYYFLEMNTRLQVEHPITELITGIDLVHWQLKIAAGEKLPFCQADFVPRGHAVECRIYAEDPTNQFLPATGTLLQFIPPSGPGVRVDTGVITGDHITTHYDPLIAKVIAHAANRPAALKRLETALHETILLGLITNIEFLQAVLSHPEFRKGAATTQFNEQHMSNWKPPEDTLPLEVLLAAVLSETTGTEFSPPATHLDSDPYSPWNRLSNFRLSAPR